jgi:hypothetical protein
VLTKIGSLYSDGSLFASLPTPLVLVPIYCRAESVVAKLIELLLSLGTVGNYFSTLFVHYLPYRKTFELQLVGRNDICTLGFLFRFGFKQGGRKESPISFLVKDDIY